jgi:hypothetical protein
MLKSQGERATANKMSISLFATLALVASAAPRVVDRYSASWALSVTPDVPHYIHLNEPSFPGGPFVGNGDVSFLYSGPCLENPINKEMGYVSALLPGLGRYCPCVGKLNSKQASKQATTEAPCKKISKSCHRTPVSVAKISYRVASRHIRTATVRAYGRSDPMQKARPLPSPMVHTSALLFCFSGRLSAGTVSNAALKMARLGGAKATPAKCTVLITSTGHLANGTDKVKSFFFAGEAATERSSRSGALRWCFL